MGCKLLHCFRVHAIERMKRKIAMPELVETPVVEAEFAPVFYPPTAEIYGRGTTAGDIRDYVSPVCSMRPSSGLRR